uniref:Uncharacterized protein n=1 Tax=Leersia perrieri TaxID=77586 RepID=A0A0D9WIY6_9ORYZ
MEEELDEFEVLWPDTDELPPRVSSPAATVQLPSEPAPPPPRVVKQRWSRPVDVPVIRGSAGRWKEYDDYGRSVGDRKVVVVPPHLLLLLGSMRRPEEEEETAAATLPAFATRPCKRARDLRHLRNSVLRMTGFIEG